MAITLENEYVQYVIGSDGTNRHLIDKRTDTDHCAPSPFARISKADHTYDATGVSHTDGRLTVHFGDSGVRATIGVTTKEHHFILEVLSVTGDRVEEFTFLDLSFNPQSSFVGCALALNLQTKVPELPGPNTHLQAACYPRFGFTGAKVALIGCPEGNLRRIMQEVVDAAEDLPHSAIGGPRALDAEINRGSYLFNFGDLSEEKVDDWIGLAGSLGINQIDFHGGTSFRFGDCRPNPETYPRGLESLRAVTDRLHAAGIKAGLHTYAFFIDKNCPWVTPVPDPRLAKDATFTLTSPLASDDDTVPVLESTQDMSTTTGFFVRNSITLQVDDELITYTGISKEPPYAFTGCQRGACGTQPAAHAQGAQVHHLKECFGLFVPDGESTLYAEVAARTAQAFNEGGFDMMYMDALDGEDIVGGGENGWHYGSKFVFEIWKRLERPALMEMSTFHHHLWYVRARMGAWDHPTRSHKRFIDIHCAANESCRRMFLPAHLGWWSFKTWSGAQGEPTFPDDIEYLGAKCIGEGNGLSIMGVDPYTISEVPALPQLSAILKRYEDLRHAGHVPETIKAKLRVPGDEFTLTQTAQGDWTFRPIQYEKHKVERLEGWSNTWRTHNRFDPQPVQLRIQALMSAGPYDASGNIPLADFTDTGDFGDRNTATGITASLQPSSDRTKAGSVSGQYTASNPSATREGTWAEMRKVFAPPLNLEEHQGIGLWIHGDGGGELLNVQLRSPEHISGAIGEHYITIDFTGWRYIELIEPEGECYADYTWPYGHMYAIYRESVSYGQVETLSLWYNNLPPGGTATCHLSPIKALPLVTGKLIHPAVTIGDQTIRFPVEIESGHYLEFRSASDCTLYGPQGERIQDVEPEGEIPLLKTGDNPVTFTCEAPGEIHPRAYVTVISQGEPLR